MSALGTISIKTKDGVWKNYTLSINDDTNEYGQNIKMYDEQTKEQREAKAPKNYIGNGRIFWTDGKITKAEKVEKETATSSSSEGEDVLPF
tara:strand:+ start:1666 stop:1938 length:273 start_codon:yes stop_codon:yes gene_type:complete